MVKVGREDTLPICYYCFAKVRWRWLNDSGVMAKVAYPQQQEPSTG